MQCREVENPNVMLQMLTPPLKDTDVCQSSCDGTTAVDDAGMTPQMKRSRLAQVCKHESKSSESKSSELYLL